ncbi:MAG: hypothetical protein IJ664_09330, partial [Clostridia bacterium]|nr:hypothetical protein [Clostridia bacterium]
MAEHPDIKAMENEICRLQQEISRLHLLLDQAGISYEQPPAQEGTQDTVLPVLITEAHLYHGCPSAAACGVRQAAFLCFRAACATPCEEARGRNHRRFRPVDLPLKIFFIGDQPNASFVLAIRPLLHKRIQDRATVRLMLRSREYAGYTVSFKTYSKSYKLKKRLHTDPANLLLIPNTQEA